MQYRNDKQGNPLSALGFGCMRFPRAATGGVNLPKAEEAVLAAVEAGVNYFDTAYIYPGSEAALGAILARNHLRDKVNIATKLPHYLLKKPEDAPRYFAQQLERLQTNRVDYYLMHMLTDVKTWQRLCDLGVADWLQAQKQAGAIGQIGFSYHGNSEMFCRLVDAYDWDFCMIQYNYLDEHSQAGVKGLRYAAAKGLPVMIMEPLRGGKLVRDLPREALRQMERHTPRRSPAEWALRWLWNQPEVTCVLSGMNSAAMVRQNAAAAADATPGAFTPADRALISRVKQAINGKRHIACTGCRYCMPCPHGVDIPGIFAAYNRRYYDNKFNGLKDYFMCTALRQDSTGASNCVGCGLCERHCPQHLPIRTHLKTAQKVFEGPLYRVGKRVFSRFVKY